VCERERERERERARKCSVAAPLGRVSRGCTVVAQCPWGVKAFTGYLGSDAAAWKVLFCP
jgi:hypothetical protein